MRKIDEDENHFSDIYFFIIKRLQLTHVVESHNVNSKKEGSVC